VALRFRAKLFGRPVDEVTVQRGEQALPAALTIVEDHLTHNEWMMDAEFGHVDCAYCPVLNVIEKSGFGYAKFPRLAAYLDACRARPSWEQIPRLPGL
jgi:glutathione S-transferase